MTDRAIELLEEQQRKVKERSAPWMVAEQLKDICRREPHSAEILAQDLENASMSITEAEKKIKAFADGHRSGGFACVTPGEADAILREFYGLGAPGGTAAESGSPKILNLADFLCGAGYGQGLEKNRGEIAAAAQQ